MFQQTIAVKENQTITFNGQNGNYKFRIYPFRGLMYMDCSIRDVTIFAGKRIMANQWLLPEYLTGEVGNLRFETYKSDSDEYVWWEEFNKKFRLVQYSATEISEMKSKEM